MAVSGDQISFIILSNLFFFWALGSSGFCLNQAFICFAEMGFGCEDDVLFFVGKLWEWKSNSSCLFIREVEGQGQGQQRFYKGYPWTVDFVLLPRLTYV